MVIDRAVVERRLKELDLILGELSRYEQVGAGELERDLSLRWTVERGLQAALELVFDVLDHLLSGAFGQYPETYEDSLAKAEQEGILSRELYQSLAGMGGFRNVIVHEYLDVDLHIVAEAVPKVLALLPRFAVAVLEWLEAREG